MTGPEHYREAEILLGHAAGIELAGVGWMPEPVKYWLAAAQVHATLAQAAAVAELDGYATGAWAEAMTREGPS